MILYFIMNQIVSLFSAITRPGLRILFWHNWWTS